MFMTPLIFHAIDFSAREVGSGLAVAAQGRGLQNPMIVVEAMVYHIVNDDSAQ